MNKLFKITKQNYSAENLSYMNFTNLQMIFNNLAIDFERADFRGSNFDNCIIRANNFDRADFIDLVINKCIFNEVNFGMSLFKNCYIENTHFNSNSYNSTAIQECIFKDCTIQETKANWTLYDSTFNNCTFINTCFNNSAIDTNKFINCTFINCNLAECHMENIQFKSCCFKNIEFDISYLGSYLMDEMDMSVVKFKYRGKLLSLTSFPDEQLELLLKQQRYFDYLNILILRKDTYDLYNKVVKIFNNLMNANKNIRIYNIKNILKMFEFYNKCNQINYIEFQKIIIFLNNIKWSNIEFEESLEYNAILYRINCLNTIDNIPIKNILQSNNNENCVAKIHINSNNPQKTILEFEKICNSIESNLLHCNNKSLFEIINIEQGSVILIISSALLLVTMFAKVAVSVTKSVFEIKMEKAINEKEINIIKNAKNHTELTNILNDFDNRNQKIENNYLSVLNKIGNSLLFSEIISIIITLLI